MFHPNAKWLDQLPILNSRGARRLAGPAIEAKFKMTSNAVIQLELAIGDTAHEINPPARALVLIARFDVRRAGRGAQSAMHAIEQQLVIERCARIIRRRVIFRSGHRFFTW